MPPRSVASEEIPRQAAHAVGYRLVAEHLARHDGLRPSSLPIGQLHLNPANPRINDDAVEHVAASIRRLGWRQPIVVRPGGEAIAGNTRLKAARSLEHAEVPVVGFEGSDLEATVYAIADNRTHEFSRWDERALVELLAELRQEDALEGVGFSDEEIEALLADLQEGLERGEVDDPGPGPPPEIPVTRPGDLWQLGAHRLLCGDATDPRAVARLMGEERARLMATDPPYCVDYTGNDRPHDSGKDWSKVYNEIEIADRAV